MRQDGEFFSSGVACGTPLKVKRCASRVGSAFWFEESIARSFLSGSAGQSSGAGGAPCVFWANGRADVRYSCASLRWT